MNNTIINTKVSDITKTSLMIAMLCVSSYIAFPIPFTPIMITAQTIIINLIALVLDTKKVAISISTFLLIGVIGVPVFSGGQAGISTLIGPSGGFLFGFLISAIIINLVNNNKISFKKYLALTIIIGMPIIYICGTAWMSYYNGLSIIENIKLAVLPFILGDIIKCVIASTIAVRINKMNRYNS